MSATPDEDIRHALPCHLVDPEVFFADAPDDVEYAKTLCAQCPMRAACLAAALERTEAAGVWGGELLVDGVVVARKRGRGRPRKHPAPTPTVKATRDVAPNPLHTTSRRSPRVVAAA